MATQAMLDLLEADRIIDTSQNPWQLVLVKRGTGGLGVGEELLRQDLLTVDGEPLTNSQTIIGSLRTPG